MRIKTTCITIALFSCYLSGVAVASSADTMVITYRSGKVQNVFMDEPSEEVKSIGYFKIPLPSPEIKAKELSDTQTDAEEGARTEQPSPKTKKHGVIFKWAPPIDQ